jgi:hypothetical protein
MRFTRQTAGAAGKKGGQARSPRKAVAAVQNGRRGGRPKTKLTAHAGTTEAIVYEIPGLPAEVVAQMKRDARHSILHRFAKLGP